MKYDPAIAAGRPTARHRQLRLHLLREQGLHDLEKYIEVLFFLRQAIEAYGLGTRARRALLIAVRS